MIILEKRVLLTFRHFKTSKYKFKFQKRFVFSFTQKRLFLPTKPKNIISNMKPLKSLSILAVILISAFVITTSSCGGNCTAPSIVFDPSTAAVTLAPGEKFSLNIVVTGDATNIASIVVSKASNGVTDPAFLSLTGVASKGKTVALVDSVPNSVSYGSVITYTVTATSDCKDAAAETKTYTVTVGPSSKILDPLYNLVENSQAPRCYSRFSAAPQNNSAWQLIPTTLGNGARFATDPNDQKDIRDSLNSTTGNPFTANARWGSRNGSKFVKAPSNFDFTNASAKSIIDAYKAGVPSDLITIASGDFIIINIKNANRYAVIRIKSITDDGAASNEDYVFFSYKLAQL